MYDTFLSLEKKKKFNSENTKTDFFFLYDIPSKTNYNLHNRKDNVTSEKQRDVNRRNKRMYEITIILIKNCKRNIFF